LNGKALFIKYWLIGEPLLSFIPYYYSTLPGMKNGISGSMIEGDNIGIIKNISEEKKEAALEVLKYFTSKEYQSFMFKEGLCITSLRELWDEEEMCEYAPCDLVKGLQCVRKPQFIKDGPEGYEKKYRKYIYQYLYEDEPIEEILKKILDVTKFYTISLNTEDSYVGLIFYIFISVITVLMLLSLFVLSNDNFHPFFMLLPSEFWIITVLGSIMILWIPILNYGMIESIKCHFKSLLFSIGYSFTFCPTLHKLILQFPEENKIIRWIINHKYMFLLLNIIIDALLNSISLINKYTVKSVMVEDGESFQLCNYKSDYSVMIIIIYKILILLLLLFLIFVEWNVSETMYDVKFILSALYIDMLSTILIVFFFFIQIKYYTTYFLIQAVNISIISITNYIFLYGIRVFLGFIRKQNVKLQFINRINEKFVNNETQFQSKSYKKDNTSFNNNCSVIKNNIMDESVDNGNFETSTTIKSNFISRMIDYHYSTSIFSSNSGSMKTSTTTSVSANFN